MLAMFQTSPASPQVQTISQFVTAGQRREFADFTRRSCPCEACLSEQGTQLERIRLTARVVLALECRELVPPSSSW